MRIYAIDLHIRDIRSWVIEQKFTPHGLAKKCGLGPGTLANMMDPSWNPSVSTLRMIDNYKNDHENEQQERQKSFEEQFRNMTEAEQKLILGNMANLRKKR